MFRLEFVYKTHETSFGIDYLNKLKWPKLSNLLLHQLCSVYESKGEKHSSLSSEML